MKPHPSFFLKAVFNFLPLQHCRLCKGGMGRGSLPSCWSHCILLGKEQEAGFCVYSVLGYVFLVLKTEQFKNILGYVLWL